MKKGKKGGETGRKVEEGEERKSWGETEKEVIEGEERGR